MRYTKNIIGFFLTMLVCSYSVAQTDDCEQTLNRAQEEFNAGHFTGLAAILKPCIDRGFTREQRQRAYLLLTQTYLLLDDPISAEDSYLKLLKANPEFVTDPKRDPIDVVYLSKKFTASPIFSLFGKIGANTSLIRVIHYNYTSDSQGSSEKYTLKPGWQASAGVDWHITDNIIASGEVNYAITSYKDEEMNIFGRDTKEVLDRQNWFSIPLSIKYADNSGRLRPYGYLGFSANILVADKISVKYFDNDLIDQSPNTQTTESALLDFKYKRNAFNRSFFLGGGMKYKLNLDYVFVDVRYAFGLSNLVNPETLYANTKLDPTSDPFLVSMDPVTSYNHVDDYFRMDNLAITVGYVHPLYKPRKLKNAKTKSVLRKITNQKDEVK